MGRALGVKSVKQRFDDFLRTPGKAAVASARVASTIAMPLMVLIVVSPLLVHPWTLGQHNWDQMNTQREVVVQTILRFHQFPFWDPFTCGGHAAWGALESDPIVVSPWLPVYLLAPLPIAIRVEIIVSAVVGALGAWRLASRFTDLRVLRVLCVVLTVVNSHWAMQIAAGHTWHLLYGLFPWILYLFDRAIDARTGPRGAVRDVTMAGSCLALMVYGCGIYPVPHTAFALAVYALFMTKYARRPRALAALAGVGAVAVGLSAPKLLPLFEELGRFSRAIKSDEAIYPQYIPAIFTRRTGDYRAYADFVSNALWHEWGLYVGWPALVAVVMAIWVSRGPRERALKWAGMIMFSFVALAGPHPILPWRLLHLLPIFKSQHVPARWIYVTAFVLACCAASGADRWLRNKGALRPGIEVILGFAALALAVDMGAVARQGLADSFVNPAPAVPASVGPFHMVHRLAPRPDYVPGLWDISTTPAVLENVGTLECDTDQALHVSHRDLEGRVAGLGAYGDDDPDYRGEVYVAEHAAKVTIESLTPNEVRARVEGAQPGDHVVLNQNWDPGWTANGTPAVPLHDAVSAILSRPEESVVFRYAPRWLWAGLAVCVVTVAAIAVAFRRARRDPA